MDIEPNDLKLLVTLDVLLSEGSVTAAARRLGVSQPALSAQLARLRNMFGDPLLVMSGRRMVPTTRAEALRTPLQRMLRDLEGVIRTAAAFDPTTSTQTFRVGGTDYVHAVMLQGFVGRLNKRAPGLRIALMAVEPDSVWQDLESGRTDAAVVTNMTSLPHAKSRRLRQEEFVLVQRKGHPRGNKAPDLDEFCALDHILVSPEGGGFVGAVDHALEKVGKTRRVAVSVPSFLLVAGLVSETDLVCVLPERLAQSETDRLDILPLRFAPEGFGLQLIWHPRRQHDSAHVWLRDELVRYLQDDPEPVTEPAALAGE